MIFTLVTRGNRKQLNSFTMFDIHLQLLVAIQLLATIVGKLLSSIVLGSKNSGPSD